MSLAAASSALRRYQIDLHCAGLPLEPNIHSLPQPAGPVKVANGGHLSGTKKQVAGYDENSWLRLGNLREQAALWLRLTARHWGAGVVVMCFQAPLRRPLALQSSSARRAMVDGRL